MNHVQILESDSDFKPFCWQNDLLSRKVIEICIIISLGLVVKTCNKKCFRKDKTVRFHIVCLGLLLIKLIIAKKLLLLDSIEQEVFCFAQFFVLYIYGSFCMTVHVLYIGNTSKVYSFKGNYFTCFDSRKVSWMCVCIFACTLSHMIFQCSQPVPCMCLIANWF